MRQQLIIPPTPRLIEMAHAAAFLGIGERTFETLWRTNRLPQPHRIGRRLLWDVKVLDRYVDALSGLKVPEDTNEGWFLQHRTVYQASFSCQVIGMGARDRPRAA